MIKKYLIISLVLCSALCFFGSLQVSAETIECADGSVRDVAESDSSNPAALCASAGGIKPGATVQPGTSADSAPRVDCAKSPDQRNCIITPTRANKCIDGNEGQEAEGCGFFNYINDGINLLSAAIGIVATCLIIVGGIQYSAAGADPGAVEKAKNRIFTAVFMLIGFGLIYAVAQWLIPGGIL